MPYPVGFGGIEALQTPPTIVPLLVAPHEFSADVQAVGAGAGQLEFGGVFAEHEPLHKIVPGLV